MTYNVFSGTLNLTQSINASWTPLRFRIIYAAQPLITELVTSDEVLLQVARQNTSTCSDKFVYLDISLQFHLLSVSVTLSKL